jgi:putative nucleotidyltransferase with HDIG domain
MIQTKDISKLVYNIPMLSAVAFRLLEMSGDENVSIRDIVKIVEKDAFLVARIMKIANSAACFRGRPIATLGDAVVRLGEKTVVGIALESSSSIFKQSLRGYESPAGELWSHSLHTAIAAREISQFTDMNNKTDLAYTAGLLHDIGKPVISELIMPNIHEMTNRCDKRQVNDFADAEKSAIGLDHAQAGYELALHWKLPQVLCMPIGYHHKPAEAMPEYQELVYIVHIADILAMMEGAGTGADVLSYRIDEGYKRYLKIDKSDIASIMLFVRDEFAKTQNLIFGGKQV